MTQPDQFRERYLDLLAKVLVGQLTPDPVDRAPAALSKSIAARFIARHLSRRNLSVCREWPRETESIETGSYSRVPATAFTMVGRRRLANLRECVESVVADGVPGDLIETGVWRGGALIYMLAVLSSIGDDKRVVWAADSFQGLPPPTDERDAWSDLHTYDDLAVSQQQVAANIEAFGLLSDRVRFLEGWFRDTLPTVREQNWAIIRLDGDLYESTMDGLTNLLPGLSPGGYVIVDDYGAYEACRQAVHDYRDANGITAEIHPIDHTGVFWRNA